MNKSQIGGKLVISLRFKRVAKVFIGLSHLQVKRWVELPGPFIRDRVGMVQRNLIPTERFCGIGLKAGEIMGGNTRLVIIRVRFPGLLIKRVGIFGAMLEFGARTFKAELDNRITGVHGKFRAFP